ncbi:TAXI family TRAP transporter solute-binding subunit [Elioraea sp. Yellowstone]|jgi:TRAP transporter TAXI family solute receptor|uniref:TAXI family TRAP transporter solute-binding subunit n=1 Tax=Elioraea sp. Yellowstone TaxID=2592070 RepID=UPI0011549B7A|nr:TAXI family TRAP transporter solute-binding subunit [Elioraea sp. Yellowstone]TQF78546.1 TAXI family TRAP transporter solute-binding subunit [Elioraea sp. Yellowstone]
MTSLGRRTLLGAAAALPALARARAQEALRITLAGGSVGGAWSAIGNAIGEAIRRQRPGSAFSYEPGRDAANVTLVAQGRVQLGIAHAQIALRAIKGEPPFDRAMPDLRAVSLIDSEAAWQPLVRAGAPVSTLEEIAARRVPVRVTANLRGTLMALATEEAFAAAGAPFAQIERWGGKVHYVAWNDALEMLKNNQVDIITNVVDFPSRQVINATRGMEVRFLGFGSDLVAKVNARLGSTPVTIPANAYPFQPEPVHTFRAHVILLTAAGVPADTIETVVQAMLAHFDQIQRSHATMARLQPAALPDTGGVALHDGAARAYRAAGLIR